MVVAYKVSYFELLLKFLIKVRVNRFAKFDCATKYCS
jgi:hypothetical protein